MTRYLVLSILIFSISGCCSIDKRDFDFNSVELNHFSDYKEGDTLYFESNLGDTDTITITGFGSEKYDECGGFLAKEPLNGKWVNIKHLPADKWQGTSQDMTTGGKTEIVYQALFWATKYPGRKITEYNVSFRDFHSRSDTIIGEYHTDTLLLNDLELFDYFMVEHAYPERVTEPKNIETVFWTDRYGLTAYKSKDGEIWTRRK